LKSVDLEELDPGALLPAWRYWAREQKGASAGMQVLYFSLFFSFLLKSVDLEELDLGLYFQPGDIGPGNRRVPVLGCRYWHICHFLCHFVTCHLELVT